MDALPGYPDNLNRGSDGGYWVALLGMRMKTFDLAMRKPAFRRRVAKRLAPDEWIFPNINRGCVVRVSERGEITEELWNRLGAKHPSITSTCEHKGWLYLEDRRRRPDLDRRRPPGAALMLAVLRALRRALLDRDTVIAAPPMEGPFKPNARLEQAERRFILPDVDSVATAGGAAYCSAGRVLYRIEERGGAFAPIAVQAFESGVTFLVGASDGGLIVGVESDGLHVSDRTGSWRRVPISAP